MHHIPFLMQQGPVLGGLARIVYQSLTARGPEPGPGTVLAPGPELEETVAPRSRSLVAAYVRHVGGEPGQYRTVLPFHLYPQWAFPILGRALEHVPFDLITMVNAGTEVTINQMLPADVPLRLRARLEETDINERRARFRLRLVTGTDAEPRALEVRQTAVILLSRKEEAGGAARKGRPDGQARPGGDRARPGHEPGLGAKPRSRPRVPARVREVGRFRAGSRAGLDFAMLTGDINPLHWLKPYARAMGHPRPIMHGFALFARVVEILNRRLYSGDIHRIKNIAVRLARPLGLPADVGVFIDARGGLFAGTAPAGPAFLTGSFNTDLETA